MTDTPVGPGPETAGGGRGYPADRVPPATGRAGGRVGRAGRIRIVLVGLGSLAAAPAVQACSDEASFAVGDCVRIEQEIIDSDLTGAECDGAVGTFDGAERVYRVDSVIGDTDGGCPQLQGFFPVEFVHEPDGVTYCLVQQD